MDARVATGEEARSRLSGGTARAVLRVADYERAKAFYRDVLGLPVDDVPGVPGKGLVMASYGTSIELYERPGLPPPENTVLAFHAVEFDETMCDLRERGVVFEDYDIPETGLKTVDGVAEVGGTRIAWFRDTEGNILAVSTM